MRDAAFTSGDAYAVSDQCMVCPTQKITPVSISPFGMRGGSKYSLLNLSLLYKIYKNKPREDNNV